MIKGMPSENKLGSAPHLKRAIESWNLIYPPQGTHLFCNDLRPPALLGIFDRPIFKIVATAKQISPHNWLVFKAHTHKSELHETLKISYVYDIFLQNQAGSMQKSTKS